MDKMKELYEKVAADSTLQEKFNEIITAAEKAGAKATEAKLVAFAKEAGYEVTVDEMGAFFTDLADKANGELSETELDMVAGGKGGHILFSVGTVGYGCAASSVAGEKTLNCKHPGGEFGI